MLEPIVYIIYGVFSFSDNYMPIQATICQLGNAKHLIIHAILQ